jgi:ribosome-associated protein
MTPPTPPKKAAGSRRFPAQVQHAITAAQDRKAVEVVVLDLRPANGFADYFLVCSGTNPRQIKAISDSIQEKLGEKGLRPAHVEGYDHAGWILLDYFDFIVHIFSPEARAFYDLERLWGTAKKIEVPEPEPPAAAAGSRE